MSRGNVRIAVLQPRCTACSKSGCPTVEVNDVVVEKETCVTILSTARTTGSVAAGRQSAADRRESPCN